MSEVKKITVKQLIQLTNEEKHNHFGFGDLFCWDWMQSISDFFSEDNSLEILENERLKDENLGLRFSLDSLSESFNSMFKDYNAIKNKKSDTVFVFSPVDSIRCIDSIRYVFRDSVFFIPHDTLIIHLRIAGL